MAHNSHKKNDFRTILSEEEKNILDDLPNQAVEQFFSMKPSRNVGIDTLTVTVLTDNGVGSYTFEGEAFYEAYDYLEYLMVNGFRQIVDAYMKEKVNE